MILCVYGAGGSGKTVIDLAKIVNKETQHWEKIVFVDDVIAEKECYGLEVYSFKSFISKFSKQAVEFVISSGEPQVRKLLYQKVKEEGYLFANLIHPEAEISENVKLGEGVIVARAWISGPTIIGDNTGISQNAIIGHDTRIGEHSMISPGVFVAGECKIGECVYIGPHAAIKDRINVGYTAIVGMSAAVYNYFPS